MTTRARTRKYLREWRKANPDYNRDHMRRAREAARAVPKVRANGCADCNMPKPAHEERCSLCRKVHAKRQAALQVSA